MASDENEGSLEDDLPPKVAAFVREDADELPALGEPVGDDWDPLLDGERIRLTSGEE